MAVSQGFCDVAVTASNIDPNNALCDGPPDFTNAQTYDCALLLRRRNHALRVRHACTRSLVPPARAQMGTKTMRRACCLLGRRTSAQSPTSSPGARARPQPGAARRGMRAQRTRGDRTLRCPAAAGALSPARADERACTCTPTAWQPCIRNSIPLLRVRCAALHMRAWRLRVRTPTSRLPAFPGKTKHELQRTVKWGLPFRAPPSLGFRCCRW
jgi:hypothetical protein